MKHNFTSLAMAGALLALMHAAFVMDIDGARNVLLFYVWAMSIMSVLLFSDVAIKDAAKRPRILAPVRWLFVFIRWALLANLVWHGHSVTAATWALCMLAMYAHRNAVEGERRARA